MISFYILVIIGAILLWILLANIGTFKLIGWISSHLSKLATRQKKIRNTSINKDIEYTYLNYDLEDAKKKYDSVYTEISEIQEELNIVNSSAEYKFEIDIDL